MKCSVEEEMNTINNTSSKRKKNYVSKAENVKRKAHKGPGK